MKVQTHVTIDDNPAETLATLSRLSFARIILDFFMSADFTELGSNSDTRLSKVESARTFLLSAQEQSPYPRSRNHALRVV